jgi:hypothetical protein
MDSIQNHPTQPEIQIETPLKASFISLTLKHKFATLIALVSLLNLALPHQTFASMVPEKASSGMVFTIGAKSVYIEQLTNLQLDKLYSRQHMQQEIDRQLELQNKLKDYLADQDSPLADYTSTLIQLNNWKKIIALSNAESGMCKHYPVNKSNCWGIGGANLWYMGSNLGEGILSMNRFLNTYPNNSKVKYTQMTFKQMNGLYKQPAAQHWVDNNQIIYDDLTAIENSL